MGRKTKPFKLGIFAVDIAADEVRDNTYHLQIYPKGSNLDFTLILSHTGDSNDTFEVAEEIKRRLNNCDHTLFKYYPEPNYQRKCSGCGEIY